MLLITFQHEEKQEEREEIERLDIEKPDFKTESEANIRGGWLHQSNIKFNVI